MLGDFEYGRQLFRSLGNGIVKGWFHDPREDVLDERCFSEHIFEEDGYSALLRIGSNLDKGRIFSIEREDVISASSWAINTAFDQYEYCGIPRFIYTNFNWCKNNFETCYYQAGVFERLATHGIQIGYNAYSIFTALNNQHECTPDPQALSITKGVVTDIFDSVSYVLGFKGTWDHEPYEQ